jgi:hypothetical protein
MPELSTDIVNPTPLPIDAVHSLAALQFVLLQYGDGQPFPTKNFPGWSIQFQYSSENDTKHAYLWPRSGETKKYIRFIGQEKNSLNIPWLEIILPDGTAYPSTPVELFNPQDPQNPTDGNEKLILFPVFLGKMTQDQRQLFSDVYLSHPERFASLFEYPNIDLAQEGGYYSKLGTNSYYDPTSLDSLLGMEGNDVRNIDYVNHETGGWYAYFPIELQTFMPLLKDNPVQETNPFQAQLTPSLQRVVLVISP